MSSSRLPGKVLLDIAGQPMIGHVIARTLRARTLDLVTVATTTNRSDDPIAGFCDAVGVPCARGSLHDVLDRYYQSALIHKADVIVRITADCPLIDPELIDGAVALVNQESRIGNREIKILGIGNKEVESTNLPSPNLPNFDFACNRLPPPFSRTFPIGLDVEVCTFTALERAWRESTETFHREHVMPFLYEGVTLSTVNRQLATGISPRGFRIAQLHNDIDYGAQRWTVDTPEDLEFIRRVFDRLKGKPNFTWHDVLKIVEAEPELAQINSGVRHKNMTETDQRITGQR